MTLFHRQSASRRGETRSRGGEEEAADEYVAALRAKKPCDETFVSKFTIISRHRYYNDTLLPMNFTDYHAHVYGTGYKVLYPKLDGLMSIAAIQEQVKSQKLKVKSQNWVLLRGWDQNLWEEKIFPSRKNIDEVVSDIPVVLIRIDGHALWCNSKAFELAGITRETQNPLGGEILHDANGEPLGILLDEAMKLVYDAMPQDSEETIINILRAGLHEFAKHHVGVHDMGIPAEWWEPYKKLYAAEGDSLIKAYVFLDMTKPSGKALFLEKIRGEVFNDSPHPNLKLVGIKLYLDGALGSRGANLLEDYSDDPGNKGLRLMDDEEALHLMSPAYERGLQIATHAIGDAANSRALDLYERLRIGHISPMSHIAQLRIEHSQIVREEDIKRYTNLDVWAVIQPQFYQSDKAWAVERLGSERMKNAYRWKSFLDAGVKVAASSDSPIEDADPQEGIRCFTRRDDAEAISAEAAASLYSISAQELCR